MFTDERGEESLAAKSLFQQECLKRGVLFAGCHNISAAHTEQDVDHTLRVYRTVMTILAEAIHDGNVEGHLEGPPISAVFRRA
jgi:glutamate-1-semialdehyde 2,1-aminomutase/spore coat polysaccharide biosynthesis protein SpsF